MRYVKVKGDEPGVRRDILTRRYVFSSRYLNSEEHMNETLAMRVWCAVYGIWIGLPGFVRRECSIRLTEMNFAEAMFVCVGIICSVVIGILVATTI